jgi:hypothetical protein
VDRDGTVDDLSEGVFRLPSPLNSGTTEVAHEQRLGRPDSANTSSSSKLTNALATAGEGRVLWRIATFYMSYLLEENNYRRKNVYGCDFEGVVIVNGEAGICGSQCNPNRKSPRGI